MMHKAWCSIKEVPYCFPRSSIKVQGHTAEKSMIWIKFEQDYKAGRSYQIPQICLVKEEAMKPEKLYGVSRHIKLHLSKCKTKKIRDNIHYVKPTAKLLLESRFPKGGPTCKRQVVNPQHQTPHGQSVAKPETPMQNIQVRWVRLICGRIPLALINSISKYNRFEINFI